MGPCSGDGSRGNHVSVESVQKEREVVLTDMVCPPPEKIKKSGVTVHAPRRAVSAFHVPDDFLAGRRLPGRSAVLLSLLIPLDSLTLRAGGATQRY